MNSGCWCPLEPMVRIVKFYRNILLYFFRRIVEVVSVGFHIIRQDTENGQQASMLQNKSDVLPSCCRHKKKMYVPCSSGRRTGTVVFVCISVFPFQIIGNLTHEIFCRYHLITIINFYYLLQCQTSRTSVPDKYSMRINEDYLDDVELDDLQTDVQVNPDIDTREFKYKFLFCTKEMTKNKDEQWYVSRLERFYSLFMRTLDRLSFIKDYSREFLYHSVIFSRRTNTTSTSLSTD